MDGFTRHGYKKQEDSDRFFNRPYVKRPLQSVNNIMYQLRNDSILWK